MEHDVLQLVYLQRLVSKSLSSIKQNLRRFIIRIIGQYTFGNEPNGWTLFARIFDRILERFVVRAILERGIIDT